MAEEIKNGPAGEPVGVPNEEPAKPTFDDVLKDKDYQAEFDRRMSKGISTALERERARVQTINNKDLPEEQRIKEMTEEEKTSYTSSKVAAELTDREAAVARREMEADAREAFVAVRLPASLSAIVDYSDKGKSQKSVETIISVVNAAINEAVSDRLKGSRPPKDASTESGRGSMDSRIRRAMKL